VARLLLFAQARDAAGERAAVVEARTVAEALAEARRRYGEAFAAVLGASSVWVNGEPAEANRELGPDDELAVIPPVSGG
jgi:molybdopterin synthase sulfur carrier subunit